MKITIEAWERGLLFRNGRFVRTLEPGRHRVARLWAKERIAKVDLRVRTLVLQGQEIMTLDKVTLRVTAVAKFKVVDPVAALLAVEDYVMQTYADLQLGLREVVGALELEALLGQKGALGETLRAAVADRTRAAGVDVLDVGVRDLILPGEMKTILNQVIEARKKAEASLVMRREEVAATRSLANTAEILARNPVLLRLKELETLERIAGRGTSIVVSPEAVGLALGSKS
jgi:regulator of protease activity HflC (stomatin/prohibitin superfamily)